ncbi:D-alanine--D-alanine ligase [Desulforegula conservatrix]|uniref:D-alanine--D-alanine ligase n=1 Tax=Desulforegula conservatrix TaxID=153026 RepID=UPI000421D723|nr:D-alanine--D-alanine ligase [Desulforegula conservatrix]
MKKLRIALLAGGTSPEREVSLSSGREVLAALDKSKYDVVFYDTKTEVSKLINDAADIDAALIILHGPYGEDGRIQGLLDLFDIPYQGSGVLGSAVAMNKLASKRLLVQAGVSTPAFDVVYSKPGWKDRIHGLDKLGLPVVIKPASGGSSIGMSIVKSAEDMESALEKAFIEDDCALVEEYIAGRELTCGVIGNGAGLEALPIIEIIPGKDHEYFDFVAKYTTGEALEICPAEIDRKIADKVMKLAEESHKALFCEIYSRTDMMLREDGELFVLETNTIPGMTANSLLPKSAKAAGYNFPEFLDRLIDLTLKQKKSKAAS